jgi:DNA-binding PadR family transcriptional regulator
VEDSNCSAQQTKRRFTEAAVISFLHYIIIGHFKTENFGGYDIIKYVEKEFGCLLSPGTVYNTLYSMERDELIKFCKFKKRKKTYIITKKGKLMLEIVTSKNFAISILNRFF